ncbi:hypothetical protein [Rhodovulum sulfidophilum]|uniref:hypothetical protein n=1 Tax=Rhodovulum sulfidophilum TaxID=35806 RepID=UPI000951F578|nr:hypothetical protein [Rhodovulum sulfidophilum]MBL3554221.1 hypothetical protein [Rhodovulum sulfidophilum]MBL3564273.1 hypothetical protein [Rhodovulum sulfidophilum]OLS42319.1 hypothetical protein BV379_20685 [Rhodovulum sulfidophilum]
MNDAFLRLCLIAIAAITVISGAAQMIAGQTVMAIIATSATPTEVHLFATIGMFMVITGAMFLQSLLTRSPESAIPLWIAVQKLAAAILVAMAFANGYFRWLALGVAGFDALSAALAFLFWQRMPR